MRTLRDWASRPIDPKEERRRIWGAVLALVSLGALALGLWLAGKNSLDRFAVMVIVQAGGLGLGAGLLLTSWRRGMNLRAAAGTVAAGLNVGLALAMTMQVGPFDPANDAPCVPVFDPVPWTSLHKASVEGRWNAVESMDPDPVSFDTPWGTKAVWIGLSYDSGPTRPTQVQVTVEREAGDKWQEVVGYTDDPGSPRTVNATVDGSSRLRVVVSPEPRGLGGTFVVNWEAWGHNSTPGGRCQ